MQDPGKQDNNKVIAERNLNLISSSSKAVNREKWYVRSFSTYHHSVKTLYNKVA